MKSQITLALFAVIAVVQLAVPGNIALQQENTLRYGRQIKLKIEPYDPSQPFMGRYAYLHFPQITVPLGTWNPGDTGTAYAVIEEDNKGFAVIKKVLKNSPNEGVYVKVKITGCQTEPDQSGQRLYIEYPFDHYYLREDIAPEVDRAMIRRRPGTPEANQQIEAWVTLRVMGKTAVLEQLWLDGVPVEEYMRGKTPSGAQL